MFENKLETLTTQGQRMKQRFKSLKVACVNLWLASDNWHCAKQHKKKTNLQAIL